MRFYPTVRLPVQLSDAEYLNAQDNRGNTALHHLASRETDSNCVKALLKNGANIYGYMDSQAVGDRERYKSRITHTDAKLVPQNQNIRGKHAGVPCRTATSTPTTPREGGHECNTGARRRDSRRLLLKTYHCTRRKEVLCTVKVAGRWLSYCTQRLCMCGRGQ